jgi:hypothetical protein
LVFLLTKFHQFNNKLIRYIHRFAPLAALCQFSTSQALDRLQNLFLSLSFLATTSSLLHHKVFIVVASFDFSSESVSHLRNPISEVVR